MRLCQRTLVFLFLGWCFLAVDVCADAPEPPAAEEPPPTAGPAEAAVEHSEADAPAAEPSSQDDEPVPQNPVIVYLDRSAPEADGVRNLARSGLLSAELARQAFLMAAREELGLITRDARLGDPMPAEGENTPFVINADKEEPKHQSLWRGLASGRVLIGEYVVDCPYNKRGYPLTSKRMEKLSRGAFVEFLRKAGFDGKPIPKSDTSVPDAIEALLAEMTFTSQFSAIRQLHDLTHKEGTSDATLEALVRGYANLGCLTEYYWHPAHKVFKARAMLYADRLLASHRKSPRALWHRAYARALVGLPRYARSDLDDASAAWEALPEADRPQRPGWVEMIDAHCRYAPDEIDVASVEENERQLAFLIRHLTVERCGYLPLMEKSALDTIRKIPECYRVYDDLSRFGGIGIQHTTTQSGLSLFGVRAYDRLLAMPDLPPSARKTARSKPGNWLTNMLPGLRRDPEAQGDEFLRRSTLIGNLFGTDLAEDDAAAQDQPQGPTDLGEPSWATLGLLIRELSFMQVQRRAWFQARVWCVSPDEFIAASAPLVERHPYRAYITRYAWDQTLRDQALQELLKLELVDPELTAAGIRTTVKSHDAEKAVRMWKQMSSHFDYTAFDFIRSGLTRRIPSSYCGEQLLAVDPMSPYARMLSVHSNWDKVKDLATEWEKTGAKSPGLMLAFGDRYLKTQQFDDAARCYKAAIEICPSLNACRGLAAVYHKQGRMDLWLETLEDFLEQPDYGLGHARVRTQIAREFMSQGDYARALPYAEDGARSYAGSCLTCAAWCHEGLKNWSDAETYFRNCSERYRGSVFEWYFFCRRTGKGDLDAARQCVENALADPSTRAALRDDMIAFFHVLEGKDKEALEGFQTRFQKGNLAYNGFWVALLADQLGQTDLRDKTLKQVAADSKNKADSKVEDTPIGLPALAELLAADLDAGGNGELDPIALGRVSPQGNAWVASDVFYFASRYLEQHGQAELAADCRKHSLAEWIPERWSYILAESEMLARGHNADEFGPKLKDSKAEDTPVNESDEETTAPDSETPTDSVAT